MNHRPSMLLRAFIAALAAAGVVVAHRLAYAVGEVNVHDSDALAAGHGYLPYLLGAALGLLVLVCARYVFVEFTLTHSPGATGDVYRYAAVRLVAVQAGGFVALELGERALLGISPGHLVGESVLLLGIVAQVVLALLGAVLLALFARGVAALVKLIRGAEAAFERARPVHRRAEEFTWLSLRQTSGSISLRGPPIRA